MSGVESSAGAALCERILREEVTMSDVKAFVREMNLAWVEGRFEDLGKYFDEQVVMLMPGSTHTLRGVEPMVASYREFCSMARVHRFELLDVALFPFGGLVMCHAHFSVDYEIPSGRFEEEGMEIYAIAASGPSPTILWRTQMPLKAAES
jgi:hypothetical protein